MPTSDSLYRGVGATEFPTAPSTETTLASLDPARDILVGLLAAAINYELAERWALAVPGTKFEGTTPVADTYPGEFTKEVAIARDTRFPLLCVYRTPDAQRTEELTLERRHRVSVWGVEYVLGTLAVFERRKVLDALQAAVNAILETLEQGGHRAYATQQLPSGVTFFKNVLGPGPGCANFDKLTITNANVGRASFGTEDPEYHAMRMILEIGEVDRALASGVDAWEWTGTSFSLGNATDEGAIPDFLLARVT